MAAVSVYNWAKTGAYVKHALWFRIMIKVLQPVNRITLLKIRT